MLRVSTFLERGPVSLPRACYQSGLVFAGTRLSLGQGGRCHFFSEKNVDCRFSPLLHFPSLTDFNLADLKVNPCFVELTSR